MCYNLKKHSITINLTKIIPKNTYNVNTTILKNEQNELNYFFNV